MTALANREREWRARRGAIVTQARGGTVEVKVAAGEQCLVRRGGDAVLLMGGGVTFRGFRALDAELVVHVVVDVDRKCQEIDRVEWRRLPGAAGVSATGIAETPLGRWFRAARAQLTSPVTVDGAPTPRDRSRDLAESTRRPVRIPADELDSVAEIYRAARREGVPYSALVEAELGLSPDQARKRVAECRRRGLLPPAGGTTRPG